MANRLISLICDCSCAFCRVLSSLAFCFRSASLAFFNRALRSGFVLLLLISYWSLIAVIRAASAIIGSFMNLAFFDARAAFKITLLYALVGIISLLPWELDWRKHANISSVYSSRSGHKERNSCSLVFSSSSSPCLARPKRHWSDISNDFGISSSTPSSSHNASAFAFRHFFSSVVLHAIHSLPTSEYLTVPISTKGSLFRHSGSSDLQPEPLQHNLGNGLVPFSPGA